MDEKRVCSAPASRNRAGLGRLIWAVTKAQASLLAILTTCCALMLVPLIPSFVRGEASAGEIVFLLAAVFVACPVVFVLFEVVPSALTERFGFYEWAGRRATEKHLERLAALGEPHKAPFHSEQRCRLSPTEEVWVRCARSAQSNMRSLEVLQTRDNWQTWERLPLRLSPSAWLKCIMYQGEWPATFRIRHLVCDEHRILFEVLDLCADKCDTWPIVWRATYRPRWKWWVLKAIGPPWPGTRSPERNSK
jgi:hypothetical protein